jgi:predicted nuclease of predicted toxin-antitoxin system
MKFIVDAQLPVVLSKFLNKKGFDVIHTDNLPNKEFSTDKEIRETSLKEGRVVITKDSDFIDSYYITGVPERLLLVSTGNIKNKDLILLFDSNMEQIVELFNYHSFIELTNTELLGHE